MLLSSLLISLFAPAWASESISGDSFHESLTLHPLPDGKLSVLFEFTTHFSSPSRSSSIPQYHNSLTPPSLLLPLEQNDVAELTISFSSGQWHQRRWGEAGPLHYETGGGGGEVRGWLGGDKPLKQKEQAWTSVTHALGGLFCANLGPNEEGETSKAFGDVFPPYYELDNLTHFYLPQPTEQLCTENLTPFLSLLPSKGLSGLSALLANPHVVLSWSFQSEGIEIMMPRGPRPGHWRGWWEGVVDLIPPRHTGSRAFSLHSVFRQGLPRAFPEAQSSVLRLIMPQGGLSMDTKGRNTLEWVDGKTREVVEWDLLDDASNGKDMRFWWDGEERFHYPRAFTPPSLSVSRTATNLVAQDGTLLVRIANQADSDRFAIYSEVWPQWVKGWLSEISLRLEGTSASRPDLLTRMGYHPAYPPKVSTTTLHLSIVVPANSTLVIRIPFTKLTLKYTEHRPDAERGREIPSGVLTLLDIDGEDNIELQDMTLGAIDHRKSSRRRIYTSRLLLDVPTPDFSMPYNVIIMTCTVMAIFFGLMQGTLTRRLGFVAIPKLDKKTGQPEAEDDALTVSGKGGVNGSIETSAAAAT